MLFWVVFSAVHSKEENSFPKKEIKRFSNLRWLKLNQNGIESVWTSHHLPPAAAHPSPTATLDRRQPHSWECLSPHSSFSPKDAADTLVCHTQVPAVLSHLRKLEHLSVEQNKLFHIPSSIGMLESLRAFKAGHNELTDDELSIPSSLFRWVGPGRTGGVPSSYRKCPNTLVQQMAANTS